MPSPGNFDEFLFQAYAAGVQEPSYGADSAPPLAVPKELTARVMRATKSASLALLADRVLSYGKSFGWDADELKYEAVGYETQAEKFLAGKGDPRTLTAEGVARLFHLVGLPLADWRTLLTQAVAGYVTFPASGGQALGRTSGLSDEERATALSGEEAKDPLRASRVANDFVEEVIEAWTNLKKSH